MIHTNNIKKNVILRHAFFAIATLASMTSVQCQESLSRTAKHLENHFSAVQKTLEYHVMVNVQETLGNDPQQVFFSMKASLAPIVKLEQLSAPKAVAYLDSEARVLGKANLVLRIRPGQLTVKVRAASLNNLIDLQPCNTRKNKYERDYFGEPGYSISAEHRFGKEEWLPEPTKATARETMAFMTKHCTELAKQLSPFLKPMGTLAAPGTAQMYDAHASFTEQPPVKLNDPEFTLWAFPGTPAILAEISWKGDEKDKIALEQHYLRLMARLSAAGLLAKDQSPKTEQYFTAYFGTKK